MMDNSYPMRHHVLPVFSRPVHGQRGAAGTMNGYELSVRVIGEIDFNGPRPDRYGLHSHAESCCGHYPGRCCRPA